MIDLQKQAIIKIIENLAPHKKTVEKTLSFLLYQATTPRSSFGLDADNAAYKALADIYKMLTETPNDHQ